ncbi:MAG: hypothetical protein AB7R90_20795 [Reyranellaceae bacterium]
MNNRNTLLIVGVAVIVLAALGWFGYLQGRSGAASQRSLKPGEVLFSSESSIAGRTVVRHIDWRCQFFFYDSADKFAATAQQAIALMRDAATKANANAVLGISFAQVGSQVRGANGPVSQVALCGDMVELR